MCCIKVNSGAKELREEDIVKQPSPQLNPETHWGSINVTGRAFPLTTAVTLGKSALSFSDNPVFIAAFIATI